MDETFERFVAERGPELLRLARAMAPTSHDAWDLAQETLARMGERWEPARIDDPAAYAVTVMARLNVDRVRRWRRERPSAAPHEEPGPAVEPPESPESPAWLPAALATLSPHQRTALALRHVEDLDLRGIAARMGCSEGTVKSHLSRGTARLRAAAPQSTLDVPAGGEA